MYKEYIKAIKNAVKKADTKDTILPPEILNNDGMNGHKILIFYNELIRGLENVEYLEIGIWKAYSTVGALYENQVNEALVIDNFTQFGEVRDEAYQILEQYGYKGSVLEADCFDSSFVERLKNRYNVYIYDGLHTEIAQYRALSAYLNNLHETFIFIVDDWNWLEVRQGTENAIKDLGIEVLYKKEILTNQDNQTTTDKEGWWNGTGIFVLSNPSIEVVGDLSNPHPHVIDIEKEAKPADKK